MSPKYFVAALISVSAAACATDSNHSLYIVNNQVPAADCSLSATGTDSFIANGRIDPDSTIGYVFTPLVESRIDEREGYQRSIFLSGADVALVDASDGSEVEAFSTPLSGSIEPGGTAAVGFVIVPPDVLASFGEGDLEAKIKLFGTYANGDIESDTFVYPIAVCADCVKIDLGACSALAEDFVGAQTTSGCNPLQDGTVQCCEDGSGNQICPAVGPVAP